MNQAPTRTLPDERIPPPAKTSESAATLDEWDDLDGQLRLASQVQRDLLPDPLPNLDGIDFRTLYCPAGYVSGDTYDIARMDETHVAISLADATGHGVPAALLTVLIKHYFRGKEVLDGSYRIIPPDEVLSRLNRDLIDTNLSQCQFVAGLHSVYDTTTRQIVWARGGAPYPILIRQGQFARQVRSAGGLIGAFEEQRYEPVQMTLRPGDTLLFHTDGLEALLLTGSRGRADADITQTSWFAHLPEGAIDDHLRSITQLIEGTERSAWRHDDITIVAIHAKAT